MHKIEAEIVDIFSSIQGEGIFVGAKQIFVRFKGCNLQCGFCDEPKDRVSKLYSPVELISEIRYLELSKGPHHSVSLTGGEPLIHSGFLKVFLKILKTEGLKTYLETNGTLPQGLADVIDLVDIIAMDFKLPSSTGGEDFWKRHSEFLDIAVKAKVFVKAVITIKTSHKDVEKAISIMQKYRNIPFILQPAAPKNTNDKNVPSDTLLKFLDLGSKHKLENVRVIPQVHKILNVK